MGGVAACAATGCVLQECGITQVDLHRRRLEVGQVEPVGSGQLLPQFCAPVQPQAPQQAVRYPQLPPGVGAQGALQGEQAGTNGRHVARA